MTLKFWLNGALSAVFSIAVFAPAVGLTEDDMDAASKEARWEAVEYAAERGNVEAFRIYPICKKYGDAFNFLHANCRIDAKTASPQLRNQCRENFIIQDQTEAGCNVLKDALVDKYFAERMALLKASQPKTPENPSECVKSDYGGRASSGVGSCMLTLSNQCSAAVTCVADLQAMHASGRPQSTRRTFHLRPGASSSEGLTGVIGCQNYSYSCKIDN